jgi:hypothetical protein
MGYRFLWNDSTRRHIPDSNLKVRSLRAGSEGWWVGEERCPSDRERVWSSGDTFVIEISRVAGWIADLHLTHKVNDNSTSSDVIFCFTRTALKCLWLAFCWWCKNTTFRSHFHRLKRGTGDTGGCYIFVGTYKICLLNPITFESGPFVFFKILLRITLEKLLSGNCNGDRTLSTHY